MYINGRNITFIDRKIHSLNHYLHTISHSTPLTTDQEHDLWLRMQQGSSNAREQLISANLRYVVSIAKKYYGSKAPLEDLIQAGNEGLVRAVDKFDASLGFRFISYATWYIENEVRKAAYDYIHHDVTSLDEPLYADKADSSRRIDNLESLPCQSTDWNLRYRDALNNLKERADKRMHGLGRLTDELHQMLIDGYTTSEFAHRHHLNEPQMKRLLTILREEAAPRIASAA